MNPNRSVILIPCPFQGHINPMFQLADLLHKKGFPIIIVHTTFNAPDLTTYPNFRFERISENLTERETSTQDLMVLVDTLNTKCTPHFRDRLMKISEEGAPIGCIVADAIMHTTQSIADELGLRRFVLRTSCAACFAVFAAFPSLRRQGFLPIKESKLDDPVPDFPPLRVRDLPGFAKSDSTALYDFVSLVMASIRSSSGVIWNTFQELEQTWITRVRDEFKVRVFPIGPLHKQSPNVVSNSLLAVDRRCMSWLDQQKPKSVVYVSFGSLACMDPKQLVETAWGLANSGKPFLWVLRPGSVVGSGRAEVPEGFEEATRGRGLVVEWAPQREVLAHAAVGLFWTHSGWNSTLESVCEGVPMLCWPCFGDQRVNSRLVSSEWGLGLLLEGGLEREGIERDVKRLMGGGEGEKVRERVREMKGLAEECVRVGGSSWVALGELVDCMVAS